MIRNKRRRTVNRSFWLADYKISTCPMLKSWRNPSQQRRGTQSGRRTAQRIKALAKRHLKPRTRHPLAINPPPLMVHHRQTRVAVKHRIRNGEPMVSTHQRSRMGSTTAINPSRKAGMIRLRLEEMPKSDTQRMRRRNQVGCRTERPIRTTVDGKRRRRRVAAVPNPPMALEMASMAAPSLFLRMNLCGRVAEEKRRHV